MGEGSWHCRVRGVQSATSVVGLIFLVRDAGPEATVFDLKILMFGKFTFVALKSLNIHIVRWVLW